MSGINFALFVLLREEKYDLLEKIYSLVNLEVANVINAILFIGALGILCRNCRWFITVCRNV